jgi:hypothetical protein
LARATAGGAKVSPTLSQRRAWMLPAREQGGLAAWQTSTKGRLMVSRTLTLGLAVAVTVAVAGPAQASVVDTDRPELNGTGYDFGNGTFVAGSPTGGGRLQFDLSDGRIEPRLTGTLHLNDADGTCARVKLAYRDRGNDALTDPAYSPTRCVDDDHHHEYAVEFDSFAHSAIDDVKISLQKKTASGWSTVESKTYSVEPRMTRSRSPRTASTSATSPSTSVRPSATAT